MLSRMGPEHSPPVFTMSRSARRPGWLQPRSPSPTGRVPITGSVYYYRNRYYDASLGRFISEDPIGLRGGSNLYPYVRNNPTNRVDPLGLCPPKPNAPDFSENCLVLGICNPPAPPKTLYAPPAQLQNGTGSAGPFDPDASYPCFLDCMLQPPSRQDLREAEEPYDRWVGREPEEVSW